MSAEFEIKGGLMLSIEIDYAASIDQQLMSESPAQLYVKLRSLGLTGFGELLYSLPNNRFPRISELLPRMADEQTQKNWTGLTGSSLLEQSVNFVSSVSYNYANITGHSLSDCDILDYGCGYGRLIRLMYYFTSPDRVIGVDPWDRSVAICHDDGLRENIFLSEYLPVSLPFPDQRFDLIYAFSVFTHLSKRATSTALDMLQKYIKPDGLLAITIRPSEFWSLDQPWIDSEKMQQQHQQTGFAFTPHEMELVDGDQTYGDTSMTIDWIDTNYPSWKVVGVDRSVIDFYQRFVFLQLR